MAVLSTSLVAALLALIVPIVLFRRAAKYGVRSPWKFRLGIVCYGCGWLVAFASGATPPPASTAAAWGSLIGLLTPFAVSCVLLALGANHIRSRNP